MAKIILLPDEQFEHSHNVESESKLINGIVKFTIDGSTIKLKVGDAIKILPISFIAYIILDKQRRL